MEVKAMKCSMTGVQSDQPPRQAWWLAKRKAVCEQQNTGAGVAETIHPPGMQVGVYGMPPPAACKVSRTALASLCHAMVVAAYHTMLHVHPKNAMSNHQHDNQMSQNNLFTNVPCCRCRHIKQHGCSVWHGIEQRVCMFRWWGSMQAGECVGSSAIESSVRRLQ